MNIFRLIGDLLHILSIFLLLWKLKKSKSCVGVSCRMQEVYLIVFVCRYVDLLWSFVSVYNTSKPTGIIAAAATGALARRITAASCVSHFVNVAMKVIFILSTAYLIFLMRIQPPISQTYDKTADGFPYLNYLVLPAVILSLLTTHSYTASEVLWTFSIWLESAAIMPQLVLLQQLREVENLTSNYVAALGLYRAFYILNWIFRYYTDHNVNWIGWIGGVVQVTLYLDFFYYYAVAKWYGQKLILPFVQDVC